MQIIIVGCGKVGRTLAEQLQEEESDITLIDVSSNVITSLQNDIDAMGIVLYGMFLAIIVPVSRKKKSVLAVVALAAACSILFRYVFTAVSSGFAIILCAVLASIFGAIVFPIPEEERT